MTKLFTFIPCGLARQAWPLLAKNASARQYRKADTHPDTAHHPCRENNPSGILSERLQRLNPGKMFRETFKKP